MGSRPSRLCKVMVADLLNLTGSPPFDHTLMRTLEIGLS